MKSTKLGVPFGRGGPVRKMFEATCRMHAVKNVWHACDGFKNVAEMQVSCLYTAPPRQLIRELAASL